jgi:MFS transporter, DHA2 family, multidrug resistance protein
VKLTAIGVLGLALFVWRELAAKRPAVDLRIMKNIPFTSATMIGGILGMGLMGSIFLLPLFLQSILRYNAMQSGLAMMPRSLAMAVLMPIGGRFYNKLGPRVLVGAGLAISALSFVQIAYMSTDTGIRELIWPQVMQGAGFSLIFVALTTAALASIPKPQITAATGLYNVVRTVFGSIGIALAASQLSSNAAVSHAILAEKAGMTNPAAVSWVQRVSAGMMARGADAYTAKTRALRLLDASITRQSVVLSINHVFVLIAALFVVVLPLVLLLRRGESGAPAEIAAE